MREKNKNKKNNGTVVELYNACTRKTVRFTYYVIRTRVMAARDAENIEIVYESRKCRLHGYSAVVHLVRLLFLERSLKSARVYYSRKRKSGLGYVATTNDLSYSDVFFRIDLYRT